MSVLSRISRQARQDEQRQGDGDDRVGQGPAGEHDDRGRGERPDRAERVAQDMEVGAPGVEVALPHAVQNPQADQVHHQPPAATNRNSSARMAAGCWIRWTASTITQAAMPKSAAPLTSAARISQRW